MSKQRLFFVDNLRIFLISLVVLHHLAITYGAPGGWFYNESQAEFPEIIPLAMFVASNQAFFMGMFFFISAFFIFPSLKRKGNKTFIKERLVRLGLPLVVFYFLLFPLTIYIRNKCILGRGEPFIDLLKDHNSWGFGPMWFVEALLIFSILFLILNRFEWRLPIKFPGTTKILTTAILIGLGQFIIRIWLPIGWAAPFTDFQFPFFLQYIFLFAFGLIAWQNNWMDHISGKMGRQWFIFAQVLIFVGFPILFIAGGANENGIDKFMGGFSWQCLAYAIWEQLLGFSLIPALLGIFKKEFNKQGFFAKKLSDSAYGVFIFHTPVLVAISALFLHWQILQILKFIVLAPFALLICFLIAWLLKQIPGIKKVL